MSKKNKGNLKSNTNEFIDSIRSGEFLDNIKSSFEVLIGKNPHILPTDIKKHTEKLDNLFNEFLAKNHDLEKNVLEIRRTLNHLYQGIITVFEKQHENKNNMDNKNLDDNNNVNDENNINQNINDNNDTKNDK